MTIAGAENPPCHLVSCVSELIEASSCDNSRGGAWRQSRWRSSHLDWTEQASNAFTLTKSSQPVFQMTGQACDPRFWNAATRLASFHDVKDDHALEFLYLLVERPWLCQRRRIERLTDWQKNLDNVERHSLA